MNINIDSAIFITFLLVNLTVGLFYSRGIKSIREYAIGDRNFSTATLAATIVATWMAGSNISITVSETYSNGLYYIIPGLADGISFFIVAYFYAPRMLEFLGNLSVAEAMGNLYGRNARVITAISAMVIGVGNVAVQFSVCTLLLNHFLGISEIYAITLSSFIVITYSTFGGIKAVTFTDMIQFFTFCIILPMTAFLIWQSLDSNEAIVSVLVQNPMFDYKEFFNYKNPDFLNTALLFLFFIIPGLDPALFQRISMAKNTTQVAKSFTIAGFVMIFLEYGIIASIGILLLASNDPNLDPDSLMTYILDHYMHEEFKGLFVIGIMAMLMSTADSYINCSAVLFAHDFCKSVGVNLTEKKELLLARISALFIGISGLLLSLFAKNLLDLILSTYSFYMPIVSVPLLLAIFGFRSTSKSVLIGMGAGFVTVVLLKILTPETNNIVLGMIANMLFLFASHYLFCQDGGWIGIKDKSDLEAIRLVRKRKIKNLIYSIKNFNFIKSCRDNTPKEENFYVYFGLLCIVSIFSGVYSLPKNLYYQYGTVVNFLHYSVLIISTVFITYPVWAEKFKNESFIAVSWNIAMVYCLVFANSLLFIISNFNQTLLTILIINLITLSILLRWQVALLMMLVGILCSVEFYKWFNDVQYLTDDMLAQFKIMYSLLLVSSILIAFLKPKQEYQELTEEKNEHLSGRLSLKDKEVQEALAIKAEFLRNIPHEYHAAMTGVISTFETLREAYDKLSDKQRKMAIDNIFTSSISLKSFDDNITTLARLSKPDYELNKEDVDFSALVHDRIQACRKYYEENTEDREFILNIKDGITVNADKNYMIHLLDNLIINAIKYCKKGKISITLSNSKESVDFVIADEGIGIPKTELFDVFEPFTVSSKTRTPAGGRGIGLAVCKRIIEAHGGSISADSNGEVGATLKVVLPLV
jgi:Na+/proline symporter/signal transduction histidine kinase